jgi:hypothetical protein
MVLPFESGVKESKSLMVHPVATACLPKWEKMSCGGLSGVTRSSRASIDKARAKGRGHASRKYCDSLSIKHSTTFLSSLKHASNSSDNDATAVVESRLQALLDGCWVRFSYIRGTSITFSDHRLLSTDTLVMSDYHAVSTYVAGLSDFGF